MESNKKFLRKENPRVKANPISALLFVYMIPIFWRNYKKGLKEDDLYDTLEEHNCSKLGDALEDAWFKSRKAHSKYALHRALLKVHGRRLAFIGFIRYIPEFLLLVGLPFSIGRLVTYFERGPPMVTEREAYIQVAAIALILVVNAIILHPSMFMIITMGMKIRIACCSLIYRKSLRLSATALGETTIGQAVNLLSNDVRKFDERFAICHYVWIAPLQVVIGTFLLYRVIGVSAFAGIALLILLVPLQVFLGKLNSTIRLKTALRTDERVRLLNEILSGIQVIKMYAWEKSFARLISVARRYEIKAIRSHFYIEAAFYSMGMFVTRTSIFISIVVYIYLGNHITAETAYSVTVIYSALRGIATILFSFSMFSITEIHVSILRLEKFLNYSELPSLSSHILNKSEMNKCNAIDHFVKKEELRASPRITLTAVFAKWVETRSEHNLIDLNLNVENRSLVAVIGAVGSGKSTLMYAILKELPICSGSIDINGLISYASQEPWLFSASVKQNILFGNEYDEDRYKSVIKMCVLQSDFATFPYGDSTVISEKGKSLSGGQKARINLARCVYKRADIYLLDDPLSAVDTKVGKQLFSNCIKNFLSDKICILITHQLQYLKTADKIIIMDEGKIVANGRFDELQNSGLNFANLLRQYNDEQEHQDIKAVKSRQNLETQYEENEKEIVHSKEVAATGGIGAETYKTYLGAGGTVYVIFLILLMISAHAVGRGGDYFVSYWVNLEQAKHHEVLFTSTETLDRDFILLTYSGIILVTIISSLAYPVSFFSYFMRVSINIHAEIFTRMSFATMRFFNENPIGRILNGFSKDLGIIDEYMPTIFIDVVDICFVFIGSMGLSSIVNPYLLLPTGVLVCIFYTIRVCYLHTSRSAKRIEAITRAPIFNHLSATMSGLSTIRAFKAERILIKEFEVHQDLHSSAWYLFISSSRAFGLALDIITALFIVFITYSLLIFNKGYYGGDIGLVITQLLSLSSLLQWGMRQWAELENNMTSVERLLEYTKLETEPIRELPTNLPKSWPEFGKIVFRNVTMRYKSNESPVLKNLTFVLNSSEKIGIVGRTGAGKTSTIAALFQLHEIDGSITIDDVDITKLPLEILRTKISIIPQEPVLFSGTLRKNLDPFDEYSDEMLWNALEQVELKSVVEDSPGGLTTSVSENGTNYSVGQRQLICLARALIRNNKILVMDEATANVDPYTDSLIQKTIRKCFESCTVLTIAHRLNTVMDSDKILVLDNGEVVEFDHPHNLLLNTNGVFYSMVQTTGTAAIDNMKSIAKESFITRKS